MDKEEIKEKVKKQFKINERDYLHEWNSFGYVYELVDFIFKECKSEVMKEIEKFECFLHDYGYFDETHYEEWQKLKKRLDKDGN